jgi:hypothetical protein
LGYQGTLSNFYGQFKKYSKIKTILVLYRRKIANFIFFCVQYPQRLPPFNNIIKVSKKNADGKVQTSRFK